jgi:hypothetical protein
VKSLVKAKGGQMKSSTQGRFVSLVLFFFLLGFSFAWAEGEREQGSMIETEKKKDIVEGMNQGDFAKVLIEKLEAQGMLPPAASVRDYFRLLEKLGCVPAKGWDEEGTIDKDFLIDLLGGGKDLQDMEFDALLDTLMNKLADRLWSLGIRSVAPQTISPSGGGGSG